LPIAVRVARIVNDKAMMGTTTAERILYFFGLGIGRLMYRVQALGKENLPPGGFLLLPNHISFVDAIVLQLACPRRIRFIVEQEYYRNRILHPVLRLAGCIPITSRRAKDAVRAAAAQIKAGEVVCLFPEGQLTRSGTLLRLRRGYELIAHEAEMPVVPVWLDRLWGSIFSFEGGRYFSKWPKQFPYGVLVEFGRPLAPNEADIATVREELLKLGERAYAERPILKQHLGAESVCGLKRHPLRTAVIDGFDGTSLSCGKLLGAAIALSRHLQKDYPEKRIGIVLPPSKGAIVANLAVMLSNKVPVGLNFTGARESIESSIEQAELRTIISASAVTKRLTDFPWTRQLLKLDELLPKLKGSILFWWIAALLIPSRLLVRILGLPRTGDREEAVLLFTSGSSGKPKGVVLSHRNILGNVSQFSTMLDARKDDLILASLPFFHSFGCTVTLWYPLIEGVRVLTFPSPLEAGKLATLIEQHKATLILAAPTFLRGYLRKAKPEQLRSVRLVITGAEKLPLDLAEAFEKRLGKHVYEGYGLTETSPVVSVNLPEPEAKKRDASVQPSSRVGSTGKMAPGIAAEVHDPQTDRKLSLHESGMLWFRGPNIFEGYLNDPQRTAEMLQNGWLKSGDLGRFDEDGFLYIEGRLSRFSKIGGEMVPHEAVEDQIRNLLGISGESDRLIAVVGVPDKAKGEELILLSAVDIDLPKLRTQLNDAGVPNLWIPKSIRRIDAIPVLASGKLNLVQCKALAEQSAALTSGN
jgi:acyl-[acyl-carrier-protein]-phospholipid O-acyltransferase/long-chain-fatty-acid--[acyl-carrier-protein] ligase